MRRTCIKVDVDRIAARLSRELGEKLDPSAVLSWMQEHRFTPSGSDWWRCGDADLSKLRSDEITQVRLHVSDGAVTFVEDPIAPSNHEIR